MGLLKTVFEVNLGLFGKKPQDGYSYSLSQSFCLLTTYAEPKAVHSYSSSFEITSKLLLPIFKRL